LGRPSSSTLRNAMQKMFCSVKRSGESTLLTTVRAIHRLCEEHNNHPIEALENLA
jgi:hypothetical protein